jgi:2-amino-4-hydroxy-6-hydroxymethyldihydropteridine diphosphokinase
MGSNVKSPISCLARAAQLMDRLPLTCVTAVSNAYETAPAYGLETPCVNAVAELHTELHPLVLLGLLLDIEDRLGRVREPGATVPGPRTIDLDLAWYEGEYHAGDRLTLPHQGLGERDFVLVPLEDLMPDPVRFLTHAGVTVTDVADRVGQVLADLGPVPWETAS